MMSKQPVFIRCSILKPAFHDEFDVVVFWKTVEDILKWAKSDVHAEATASIIDAASNIASTIQEVLHTRD